MKRTRTKDVPLSLEERYYTLCKQSRTEPLKALYDHVRDNQELDVEFDFLPQEHYDLLVAALRQPAYRGSKKGKKRTNARAVEEKRTGEEISSLVKSKLTRIRLSWHGSHNAKGYIEQRAMGMSCENSNAKIPNRVVARETLALINQRRSAHARSQVPGTGKTPSLVSMPLDYSNAVQFMKLIAPCIGPHLSVLEIVGIKLSSHGIEILANAMKTKAATSLECIVLRDTELGDAGLISLMTGGLRECRNLAQVVLSNCDLTDHVSNLLCGMIRASQEKAAMKMWIKGLRGGTDNKNRSARLGEQALCALDLSWNFLTEKTAMALANAIHEDNGMHSINVSNNVIGCDGFTAMESAIRANSSLRFIDLSGNVGVPTFFERHSSTHFTRGFSPRGCMFIRNVGTVSSKRRKKTLMGSRRQVQRKKRALGHKQLSFISTSTSISSSMLSSSTLSLSSSSSATSVSLSLGQTTSEITRSVEDERVWTELDKARTENVYSDNQDGKTNDTTESRQEQDEMTDLADMLNAKNSSGKTQRDTSQCDFEADTSQEEIIALLEKSVDHLQNVVQDLEERKRKATMVVPALALSQRNTPPQSLPSKTSPTQKEPSQSSASIITEITPAIKMDLKRQIQHRLQHIWKTQTK